jgi:hypothetical protein
MSIVSCSKLSGYDFVLCPIFYSLTVESEQIGNATIDQMTRQREQMEGANANALRTRQIAEQASAVLSDMGRKAFRNKLCLYCMIGVLIIGNLWAFVRLFKK